MSVLTYGLGISAGGGGTVYAIVESVDVVVDDPDYFLEAANVDFVIEVEDSTYDVVIDESGLLVTLEDRTVDVTT
jgi:hypothetical protein